MHAKRATVLIAAAALLALALVYGAIAVLSVFQLTRTKPGIIMFGSNMRFYSEFALSNLLIFGAFFLLAAYAGLAAIWRWRFWVLAGQAAGWATIVVFIHGFVLFLNLYMPGLISFPIPIPIGIYLPTEIALAAGVVGLFVLWAMRKPNETSP